MSIFRFFFIITFASISLVQSAEMTVRIDKTTSYESEPLSYTIILTDSKPIDPSIVPKWNDLIDFRYKLIGVQPTTQHLREVINGNRSDRVISTLVIQYNLFPKRSGTLSIPPPNFVLDGVSLKPIRIEVGNRAIKNFSNPIPVTIKGAEAQDVVFMEIRTDKDRIYPLQQFTITLTIQVKGLPVSLDPDQKTSPLFVLENPPRLSIPWTAQQLPKGLVPVQELTVWLRSISVRNAGFAINDFASSGLVGGFGGGLAGIDDDFFGSPFSGMFRRDLLQFAPSPKKISRLDASGQESTYWEYKISRSFIPKELAMYEFGPVTLKGVFAVANPNSQRGVEPESIYAVAPAISVHVVDVPSENRPADYCGAFGSFDFSVQIIPRKAKVGEPMVLTLKLTGEGSMTDIKAPDISTNSKVSENFKVYSPSEESSPNSSTFSYTIRPIKSGEIVLPAISISYLDVTKNEFVTKKSEPMTVTIEEAGASVSGTYFDDNRRYLREHLERREGGMFANMTHLPSWQPSVSIGMFVAAIAGMTCIYFVTFFGVIMFRVWNSDPKQKRVRTASSRAFQRLAEVIDASHRVGIDATKMDEVSKIGSALQSVFFGFIADKTDSIEHGMTTKEACDKMRGISQETINEIKSFLESLDAARYGGLDIKSLHKQSHDAEYLLAKLRKEF